MGGKSGAQKRKVREAVAAIVKLGGIVDYDFQVFNDGIAPGPDWARRILGENFFSNVSMVWLTGAKISDADLVYFEATPELQNWLDLSNTNVSDAGLVHLAGLRSSKISTCKEARSRPPG